MQEVLGASPSTPTAGTKAPPSVSLGGQARPGKPGVKVLASTTKTHVTSYSFKQKEPAMSQATKTPGPIDHWLKLREGTLADIPDTGIANREVVRAIVATADLIFRKLEDIESLLKQQLDNSK